MARRHYVILAAIAAGALLLGVGAPALVVGLAAASGDASPPLFIIKGESMMHADDEVKYGRIGTLDPGDVVTLRAVDDVARIETLVEGGPSRFGKPGDVIVYHWDPRHESEPIPHRAVAYVEIEGEEEQKRYLVRWAADAACEGSAEKLERGGVAWCEYGPQGIYVPSVPIHDIGSTSSEPRPFVPDASGFITKGDNPYTNSLPDQVAGISRGYVVQLQDVVGKVGRELPWIGITTLSQLQVPNVRDPPATWTEVGNAFVPADLATMYRVVLIAPYVVGAIVGGTMAFLLVRGRTTGDDAASSS